MWTKERLQEIIATKMSDYTLVVVSNRQPYSHVLKSGKVICQRQPGGLVTALNPVLQATQGLWIGVGMSPYDQQVLDASGKVRVPPQGDNGYWLRRLFLSKEDMDGYYYGYSNEGLWPLAHIAYTRPNFIESDWQAYQKVNRMFADAILQEVGDRNAFVWVQDFHLTLVAKYLREANKPNIVTSLFWHIPWPNSEVFRICPQKNEILEGLLAYDMLGFHIRYHCDNFFASVNRELECRIDYERRSVSIQNHETLVRQFPISVDATYISQEVEQPETVERCNHLRDHFNIGDRKIILGIDRIDYTKGIPEKLKALNRFLEKHPEQKGQFSFLQLGQISRIHIPRYKQLNDEINALVEEINWKHSEGTWQPIILDRSYIDQADINALYRMSDVCVVSSLHDGMNLVAKEFVACRPDLNGVLLLSEFTGAARELTDAVVFNPYDTESFADALQMALTMPLEEQERRMRRMREIVFHNNIYRWAGKVLSQLLKFEFQEI
ncbi:MAG: trehalose-6-phosphate synthase [Candidatus Omnitrophica bacterium CG11_big_fil_rev_8_21_14_0_20_45_26]|uniref:Trehalose-6-phosphate synthase n=1 Tax=Candidatus Abzuiibacterium crystallinum TaxID=1974748 RepID=A0A2H0LRF7_9BACT|nr:MAG: trehalose-6-phosphate synthase [Candidatus Omnitrophica bacterium CG11_big_fil_rev_8_21_14_0_20_45_26]PIW65574.1 MAG: trehalose-6-phosphate synthase [Candidatus Omnitrophica bacterium CG12_big_fil_rev_8_21_14_0_65_45_16]